MSIDEEKPPVVIIGGGAAGMIAALAARRENDAPVLLIEKKNRLGTKILISGGGKCNLTHDGPMEDVRAKFRANEGRFLRPSFYKFTNEDFLSLLHEKGMETYVRPDGRVFPVAPSDAKDVVAILEGHLREAGVKIWLDAPVEQLVIENGAVAGVQMAGGKIVRARQLVIAVGGSSYPATGTTGDGWRWLQPTHHTIVPLRAALAPLYLDPVPPAEWSGVALRDVVLKARKSAAGENTNAPGKEIMRWHGDLLWTHKGVSGPTALGVSREIAEAIPDLSTIEVDTLPREGHDELTARLAHHAKTNPKRLVGEFVETAVPQRLVRPLMESAGVDANQTRGATLTQKERSRLVSALKGWQLGRVRHVPLERGEVVAGGVSLQEVDSGTMRSAKVRGLYLCGEILDIAGPVGGYNLQAAWSTGFVAGQNAARDWAESTKNETESGYHRPT